MIITLEIDTEKYSCVYVTERITGNIWILNLKTEQKMDDIILVPDSVIENRKFVKYNSKGIP